MKRTKGTHLQFYIKTVPSAIAKKGNAKNQFWHKYARAFGIFFIQKKISITLDYIPSAQYHITDFEFRQTEGDFPQV